MENEKALMKTTRLQRGYDCESVIVDEIVQKLSAEAGLNRKQHRKALKMILLNLYFSDAGAVRLSRSKNEKSKVPARMNPLEIGQKAIRTTLDRVSAAGYIEQVIGNTVEGRATTIKMTDALHDFLYVNGWGPGAVKLISNHDPIVLKDQGKKYIDYEDTEYTLSVRNVLKQYMELLAKTSITYTEKNGDGEFDCPEVRRIYNQCSFMRGGRIIAPWNFELKKPARETIKIDDEETVELDFPASTLNLLYRIETGARCPHEEPYPVIVGVTKIPKTYCKKMTNLAQTIASPSSTSRVFKEELSEEELEEFIGLGVSRREMIQAIREKHAAIAHHFFQGSDYGRWLQFIESELVFTIIKRLTYEGIPALSVHDSFIVKQSNQKYVDRLMLEVPDGVVSKIVEGFPYEALEGGIERPPNGGDPRGHRVSTVLPRLGSFSEFYNPVHG